MEARAPSNALGENLSCINVRWSTFDKMNSRIWGEGPKHSVAKVGGSYGPEILFFMKGSTHLVRCNPAMHPFTTELPLSHHQLYANRLYNDLTARTDTETGNCGAYNGMKENNNSAKTCRL